MKRDLEEKHLLKAKYQRLEEWEIIFEVALRSNLGESFLKILKHPTKELYNVYHTLENSPGIAKPFLSVQAEFINCFLYLTGVNWEERNDKSSKDEYWLHEITKNMTTPSFISSRLIIEKNPFIN
eukprot:gb/GECH01007944.1/.p1 GENE.gb/GECH01007944.1/~~gb/GECH01007944.1/.p1  ORF type:complete len:125 (+),score=10.81 gb/GECH01007944.1/:1-375(+)